MSGRYSFFKNIFLFIVFGFFIFCPRKVFALTYTANNNCSYDVSDVETLRDYFYFNNVNSENSSTFNYSVLKNVDDKTYCVISNNTSSNFNASSSYYGFRNGCSTSYSTGSISCYDSSDSFGLTSTIDNFQSNRLFYNKFSLIYNSILFLNCNDSSTTNANFTYQNILDKYSNLTCDDNPGGGDEPPSEESEGFNMFDYSLDLLTQFITIIPVLFGVYIIFDITGCLLFNKR